MTIAKKGGGLNAVSILFLLYEDAIRDPTSVTVCTRVIPDLS